MSPHWSTNAEPKIGSASSGSLSSSDQMGPWRDHFGRPITDLRISVTDRCNFRCGYCMPRDKAEGRSFLPRAAIIDFEEIARVAALFVEGGVKKLRLTGGEPLVRKELPELVRALKPLGAEIALTTNGVLLPELAAPLRKAGLDRLTVSLDALDSKIFQEACDAPAYSPSDVLEGIVAAEQAGFGSININCVLRRGLNEGQIVPLVEHFRGSGHVVRFIEFMDVGTRNGWDHSEVVPEAEAREALASLGTLKPVPSANRNQVARRFVLQESGDEVGFISSVSNPFCGDCSRARLSADGRLYSCLFAQEGMKLLEELRSGSSDEDLRVLIQGWWSSRRDRYSEERSEVMTQEESSERRHLPVMGRVEMSYIGG